MSYTPDLLSMELPATDRVLSQRPLSLSVASVTPVANDKGDNEMILGTVHRSPGISLTAEENPWNSEYYKQKHIGTKTGNTRIPS